MLPREFKKLLEKIGEQYQNCYEENVRLKYSHEKLKEEMYKLCKISNSNMHKSQLKPKTNLRGSDFYSEDKALVKFDLTNKLKFKAPISNVKIQGDFMLFSCNKKLFLKNLITQSYHLISSNLIIEYNPAMMQKDLSEYCHLTFEFYGETGICLFENKLIQFDLNELVILRKIEIPNVINLSTNFKHRKISCYDGVYLFELEEAEDHFIVSKQIVAPENMKSFVYYQCNESNCYVFISDYVIGLFNENTQPFVINLQHKNKVLMLFKNTIYVGGESSSLRVFLVHNTKQLEQVDVISFNKNIIGITSYLNNFIVVACANGITTLYQMDTKKVMKFKTEENIISLSSYNENIVLVSGEGDIRHLHGAEIRREKIKTIKT